MNQIQKQKIEAKFASFIFYASCVLAAVTFVCWITTSSITFLCLQRNVALCLIQFLLFVVELICAGPIIFLSILLWRQYRQTKDEIGNLDTILDLCADSMIKFPDERIEQFIDGPEQAAFILFVTACSLGALVLIKNVIFFSIQSSKVIQKDDQIVIR